jgi:Ca-activated chloride channel family protein
MANDPAFEKHPPPSPEELDRLLKSGFASVVRVDRVLVPAIVTDRKGRPVLGLKKDDFQLSEDSIPQKIEYFDVGRDERISVAFLLDISGSMRVLDKMGEAREAIRHFLSGLRPNDEVALLAFADDQVTTLAPFGSSKTLIQAHLDAAKAYGQTALNDAIAATPSLVDVDGPGRKAIVLITDGIDNASKLSLVEATSIARRTGVPIYSIGFGNSSLPPGTAEEPGAGTNAEVLKRISSETGGNFYWIEDPDEMKEAIVGIEDDLRSVYMLGYTPPTTKCDGSFRRIDLSVAKDRYHVRTRKGYVSGPC